MLTAMLDQVLVSSRQTLVPAIRLTSGTVKCETQETLPHLWDLEIIAAEHRTSWSSGLNSRGEVSHQNFEF
jgi:phosphoribosyl-dephospho-CoA transferase